jgi:membrane-bound lytic murein transglycosylase
MDVTVEFLVGLVTATAGVVGWVEKRFRDSQRDTTKAMDEIKSELDAQVRELEVADIRVDKKHDAEHRLHMERFERATAELNRLAAANNERAAALNRELAEMKLQHAHERREYPTREQIREMVEASSARLELRIVNAVRISQGK